MEETWGMKKKWARKWQRKREHTAVFKGFLIHYFYCHFQIKPETVQLKCMSIYMAVNMLLVLISVKAISISDIIDSTCWKYRMLPNSLLLVLFSGVQDAAKGPPKFNSTAHANKWSWVEVEFLSHLFIQHLFTFQIGTKGQRSLCLTEIIKHFDSEILN